MPLTAKKHHRAFIQLDKSIDSITSMCTAPELKQLNLMAHLLLSACPPLVRRVVTDQGPNTSSPTYLKGGFELFRREVHHALFFQLLTQLATGCAFKEYWINQRHTS